MTGSHWLDDSVDPSIVCFFVMHVSRKHGFAKTNVRKKRSYAVHFIKGKRKKLPEVTPVQQFWEAENPGAVVKCCQCMLNELVGKCSDSRKKLFRHSLDHKTPSII